jgi:type I restriction enzyme, S subunit
MAEMSFSDWKEIPLEEAIEKLIDYRGKTPQKTSSGIPLITAKIVKDGKINTPQEFIDEDDYEAWMVRGFPKKGDVVLTTEAPLGEVASIDDENIALAQRIVVLRGKKGLLDNTYLKYHLMSHDIQHQLQSRASGSTVLGIKQSELRKIILKIPPMRTQEKIAENLDLLYQLSKQNKYIISDLNSTISAFFRSWFIDFEPVKAKAEGKLPYLMDKETAALFPDSFEDSEIGPIPSGWELCSILELGDFLNGVASQKYPVTSEDDSLPVVKIREMQNGVTENSDWASTSTPQKYHINEGEILFSWAATLLVQHWQGNKAILNQHIFKVTPSENFPEWFVYQYLITELWKFQIMATAGETMMGHIKRKDLQQHLIVIPPNQLLKKLSETMNPLYSLSKSISVNQKHPTSIRDALLPKLMSGELSVS